MTALPIWWNAIREEKHDHRVGDPLREHGHGHGRAAYVVRKNLRNQRPKNRADARREERQIAKNQDQHECALEPAGRNRHGKERQGGCHAERAYNVERLSPVAIDHPERHQREHQVIDPDDESGKQRGIQFPTGGAQNGGSVIDDGVDSGDVHQDGQDEAHCHRPPDSGSQQIDPAVALVRQAGANFDGLRFARLHAPRCVPELPALRVPGRPEKGSAASRARAATAERRSPTEPRRS